MRAAMTAALLTLCAVSGAGQPLTSLRPGDAAPELEGATGWLQTDRPLRLSELRGKVVLLDFWTYCCINCMHVLPDLRYLEEKHPNALVVIGVHSAKFSNEKGLSNIRNAVRRYGIRHPVANDAEFRIWRAYGVRAWPTLALIDPEGKLVGAVSGEGHREEIDRAIRQVMQVHRERGTLDESPVMFAADAEATDFGLLAFPGKVLADPASDRLYIADTGHNRIVVTDMTGEVRGFFGTGAAGLEDGPALRARFVQPQGMALHGGVLYVADTGNHAIRAVNLARAEVRTIAGTGRRGSALRPGGAVERREAVPASPWDVVVAEGRLYVAMAGTHQIWRGELDGSTWNLFAGSGREDLVDGHRLGAALAQPSGLAVVGGALYFADAESSSVRRAALGDGDRVETLVGTGLFDFGDRVGTGKEARLQHPLGVAALDGDLLVADSYNHRVKRIDPRTAKVDPMYGTGRPGADDGALNEPGGIAVAERQVYIADTNNHRIVVVSPDQGTSRTLDIRLPDQDRASAPPARGAAGAHTFTVAVSLPEGAEFTEGAPYEVRLRGTGGVAIGDYDAATPRDRVEAPVMVSGPGEVDVETAIYYCDATDPDLCGVVARAYRIAVELATAGESGWELPISLPPLR